MNAIKSSSCVRARTYPKGHNKGWRHEPEHRGVLRPFEDPKVPKGHADCGSRFQTKKMLKIIFTFIRNVFDIYVD